MPLNESKGNMYEWITHTWNTVKGECPHGCTYCYMKRYGKQKPVRFDEKELKSDLGTNNFIFVGSSCDMFANDIPGEWIIKTLEHCMRFDNTYLFQTKNPERLIEFMELLPDKTKVCTTIETNRWYPDVMKNSPKMVDRSQSLETLNCDGFDVYITIEPIMDFDLDELLELICFTNPIQINIGADTGNNHLPEPSKEKIVELINELRTITRVEEKSNLKRLLK